MKQFIPAAGLAFMLSASAVIAKDEGLYIGAGLGIASTNYQDAVVDIDSSEFAYKIFGGYQFNGLLAVEGGYNDFGSPSGSGEELEIDGVDIFAVLGLPLGPFRAFGKAGLIAWDSSVDVGLTDSDDGVDYAVGVGGEFELFSVGWRIEVEYFDVNDGITQGMLGVTYTF